MKLERESISNKSSIIEDYSIDYPIFIIADYPIDYTCIKPSEKPIKLNCTCLKIFRQCFMCGMYMYIV